MSLVDDFNLANYDTSDDLLEARRSVENEISILRGYLRGVDEKIDQLAADEERAEDERS